MPARRSVSRGATVALVTAATLAASAALGAWSTSPTVNNPVCTAAGSQTSVQIVGDGAGGSFVVWQDGRSGTDVVYAQRVDAAGAPLWAPDGVAVCTAASTQTSPVVTGDGAGGAIVVWYDWRSGSTTDLYAQRLDATGGRTWAASGVPVCVAASYQLETQVLADGAGGAFVVWQDRRNGSNNDDIYAQRLASADGAPVWTADGVPVATPANNQSAPQLVGDGAGGVLVAWEDQRLGYTVPRVYAQRLNGTTGAPHWTADGVQVTQDAHGATPRLIGDGAGGAIVVWNSWGSGLDLTAQRIDGTGARLWAAPGVSVCSAVGDQYMHQVAGDGSGGAVVTWYDLRGGTDVYAQRLTAAGTAQWTSNGVAVTRAASEQIEPEIAEVGGGSVVIAWRDYRNGNNDVYAQRLRADGAAEWTADGVPICTAGGHQGGPQLASAAGGAAVVAWADGRSGTADVYAQKVNADGSLGSADTTPDAFAFTDETGVPLSSVRTSDAITVAGITAAAPVSVTGGEYDVNGGGTWTTDAATVVAGNTVRVRHTSASTRGTAVGTTLTIGGVSDTFTSTTGGPVVADFWINARGDTITSNPRVTLHYTLTGTGAGSAVRTSAGARWTRWTAIPADGSHVLRLDRANGLRDVYVQVRDAGGLVSAARRASIVLDTAAPRGLVQINAGAEPGQSSAVRLSLAMFDPNMRTEMRVKEGARFSDPADVALWEPFVAGKALTLTAGDGRRTVCAQFRDAAAKVSATCVARTTVRAAAGLPTPGDAGTITDLRIGGGNGPDNFTRTPAVQVSFTPPAGAARVRYLAGNAWTRWEAIVSPKPLVLTRTEGARQIYVQAGDANGTTLSDPAYAVVVLDRRAPAGSLQIEDGAATVPRGTPTVSLTIVGADVTSGLDRMLINTTGVRPVSSADFHGPAGRAFAPTVTGFPLDTGTAGATKAVYVWFLDRAGNFTTRPVRDTIRVR